MCQPAASSDTSKAASLRGTTSNRILCQHQEGTLLINVYFCFLVKEDWNVRITKLRKQVEEIFNLKFGK